MERGLVSHRFQSVGASGTRYSLVPLRPQVSPEEQERGEQWKGFAGEIRHEVRNLEAQQARLVAKQTQMEETTAAKLSHIAAQQKHMEETTAAKLSQLEETTAAIAAQQKHMEETTSARLLRIEAQLERLLEARG